MTAAGIDVGGTKCLGVVLAPDGSIARMERRPTRYDNDGLVDRKSTRLNSSHG